MFLGNKLYAYWGWALTVVNEPEYCLKKLWMKAGSQSSLEYHVKKKETYVIEEGELLVGLRVHRAENTVVRLKQGDTFTIPPGRMHMRIAVTDVLITEISTHDGGSADTHIVEDGRTYHHPHKESE